MKRDARRRFVLSPLEDRVVPTIDLTGDFVPDRILVRAYEGALNSPIASGYESVGFGLFSVRLNPSVTVAQALDYYQHLPGVAFAEPDYLVQGTRTPADPSFDTLWGLNNTGQAGGTFDADINAPEAWEFGQGTGDTIVAVLDTGIDYSHPDLAANMWTNPGETAGDGLDNDGNGFVDDVFGYDFANGDGDPFDDSGHGTHAAGTIGAVGDNGIGTAGVGWHTRLMALKFLGADGKGSLGNALNSLSYAIRMGARVSNNSWGGGGYSAAFCTAVEAARDAGHLFVAAAGNGGTDNDRAPDYPSSYTAANVLAVAASDKTDRLAAFSNFGPTSVDLTAPGESILSTYKNGQYATLSGSSMAAPYVAGAAALIWDAHPEWTYAEVIAAITSTVDVLPTLAGKVATSGRLNLARSMQFRPEWDGPQVIDYAFSGPAAGTLDSLRLTFDQPVAVVSFTPADVVMTGPGGPIAVVSVSPVAGSDGTVYDVKFALQARTGTFTAVVGPDVQDRSGNLMDQNDDGQNGDPTDTFVAATALDRTGPRVTEHAFLQTWAGVRGLHLTFDKAIDAASFTAEDVLIVGPDGAVEVTSIEPVSGSNGPVYEILFALRTAAGTYSAVVGPDVMSPLGDAMDQNGDGTNGDPTDTYVATTTLQDQAGPRVTAVVYGGTATRLTSIRVTFGERVRGSTFTPSDVVLRGPTGRIGVTAVAAVIGASNTQFDLSFPAQTAGGTYTLTIGPNVADVAGNLMDQDADGTPGEAADQFAGSTVLSTPVVRKPVSADHGTPLVDGGRTVSTLVVGEHLRVSDLNVKLSLTHGYASDLAITLVAPSGKRVVLAYRRGGSGDGFSGTVFDDETGRHIADGAAPFAGSFRPEQALAAFDGEDARGTWRLVIDDVSVGNAGRLTGWSLAVSGTPFAGPGDPPAGEPANPPPSAVSYEAVKEPRRNRTLWSDFTQFFG